MESTLKHALLGRAMTFELLLGLSGVVHFAIAYTYFPDVAMRAFVTGTLMVLSAIILFIVTAHL